jgi:hypothetical protein
MTMMWIVREMMKLLCLCELVMCLMKAVVELLSNLMLLLEKEGLKPEILMSLLVEEENSSYQNKKYQQHLEVPLLEFFPPPKNILFIDDVDARKERG